MQVRTYRRAPRLTQIRPLHPLIIQQVATVTISSAVNLLIVGVLLVAFVIIAPNGLVGFVQERMRKER